jgi:hypothetical protein
MNRRAFPIAAAALALAAAGCGSDDSGSGHAATASTPGTGTTTTAGLPPGLAGSFKRAVTKADIARTQKKRSELGPHQEKPKPEEALLFVEPGALTVRNPKATFVVQQDFAAGAGTLTIRGYQHPEVGAFCGPEVPQNATYSWKAAGDRLTLRAVNDPCADRDSTLTGAWTRK